MKKMIYMVALIVMLSGILGGCQFFFTGDSPAGAEVDAQFQKSPKERLPSVPRELWSHVLLDTRDVGICETLTGDVLIMVIFVDDPAYEWSEEEMEDVKAEHAVMADVILEQAAAYDVNLNLDFRYKHVSVDVRLSMGDSEYSWAKSALHHANLGAVFEAGKILEQKNDVKEAPVLLYSNTAGRAFAMPAVEGTDCEYAIIYNNDEDGSICRHELYHLFGAQDYYYPSVITDLAKQYYPDSIMLGEKEEAVTDNLTAYLIGWTDELAEDALQFLQETAHITVEYMNSEHELEQYTGYVENYQFGDGLYTGDLEFGVFQGWGKYVWNDGSCYEGYWNDGVIDHEGTFTYSNGDVYKGQFEDGYMCGQGTYTWSNGDCYSGQYEKDLRHGYGVLTWSDGAVYEGEFSKGKLQGYGTMTYPDGEVLTGYWENNTYVGE